MVGPERAGRRREGEVAGAGLGVEVRVAAGRGSAAVEVVVEIGFEIGFDVSATAAEAGRPKFEG